MSPASKPYGELLPQQEAPRAVHLMPEGIFVPAKVLRSFMGATGKLSLRYVGHALAPFLRDGDAFVVERTKEIEKGELALFDVGGWGDVRRVFETPRPRVYLTGLDAFPHAREEVVRDQIVGRVILPSERLQKLSKKLVHRFPPWSRLAQYRYWLRRVEEAARVIEDANGSVRQKYQGQVSSYNDLALEADEKTVDLCGSILPNSGRVLVAGCGTGREAIALAKAGFEVEAFDLLPGMLEAGRKNADQAGVPVKFFEADLLTLECGSRFDLIYMTSLLYSFVRGRRLRIAMLARLGCHLRAQGTVVFSAKTKKPNKAIQPTLAWACGVLAGHRPEWGDWCTWYLSQEGTIDRSFSHTFFHPNVVKLEAISAGFTACRAHEGSFVASRFQ